MQKLWSDLLEEPVLIFSVLTAATAAAATSWEVMAPIAAIVAAVGGAITRHYTRSKKSLGEDTSWRKK